MEKKDTLETIKEELEKLDPALKGAEDDESYKTAVVLMAAALQVGPDVDLLSAFTGYSRNFIAAISYYMHMSGLWKDGRVESDHWWRGGLFCPTALWLDSLVAKGELVARRFEDGELRYRARGCVSGAEAPEMKLM